MGKYISLFDTTAEFESAEPTLEKPHVSLTLDDEQVHYNPLVETRVVATYTVENESENTLLYSYSSVGSGEEVFSKIEIDGVEVSIQDIDEDSGFYSLTEGVHNVYYTLIDPTTIVDWLFSDVSTLTSICIPDSITAIGYGAFASCMSLTSVTIGNGVTSIGEIAFDFCMSLISVTIGNSVTSIGNGAFEGCSGLTSINIPSGVTTIGSAAFASCSDLTSIDIPSGVTSIGNGAFASCNSLTSMTVDSSNSTYDSRNNCNAIIKTSTNELVSGCKNTVIPSSVTSIGNSAFEYCMSLTTIDIPNSVTSIGNHAFSSCSGLTTIDIPNSVTSIDTDAFARCSGLTSVTIGNSVTSIGTSVFSDCTNLTSVNIPNSVTSISSFAFYGCSGLTSVTIGNSVTSIDGDAFSNCSGLTSITSNATTAPTISSSTFYKVKTNGTLYVPIGSSGYNVWMGTGNYYLGKYNWTKVEQ